MNDLAPQTSFDDFSGRLTPEEISLEDISENLQLVRDELSRSLMFIDTAKTIVNQRISKVQCCASDFKSIGLLIESFNETLIFIGENSKYLNESIERFESL